MNLRNLPPQINETIHDSRTVERLEGTYLGLKEVSLTTIGRKQR
jgi:hypothetical protein